MRIKFYFSENYPVVLKISRKFFLGLSFLLLLSATNINKSFGQAGEVLNFDGVDDFISLPFNLSGSYTKEAWINPTSLSGFPNILSGNNSTLYINGGLLSAGHTLPYTEVQDITPISTGVWTHVAVTFNASTSQMILYRNGMPVATNNTVAAYTDVFSYIGSLAQPTTYFNGNIDEVRYWNVVRTPAQIAASQNCELTGDEFGLLAYYKFNQGTAAGNNATITSLTDSQDKCFPYLNTTLNNFTLTGSTSNFVSAGPALSGTCSALFPNISLSGNSNCILLGDNTPSLLDFTSMGDFSYAPITKTFVIANTGGATLNIASVNISGANASDFTVSTPPATSVTAGSTTNLIITFNPSAPIGIKTATITINNDDLDEAAYSFDVSGTNAGEAKSLNFDGNDDRVDLPVTISGSYTKEAWINADFFVSPGNLLSGTNNALYTPGGQLSSGHVFPFTAVQDPVAMVTGTWYHVAVTYDSVTNQMKLYKNGVQVGATATVTPYTAVPLSIGAYEGDFEFAGYIDEVRLWKVVRSVGEIAANMNCQLTGDEPGLLAYYDFNQGADNGDNTGQTVLINKADRCGNYDGTLQNFALMGTSSNYSSNTNVPATTCAGNFENISVIGNSNCIAAGNNTPSVMNDTDFGPYIFPGVSKTFTIVNSGNNVLNISSIIISGANAASFTFVGATPTTVAANSSATFTILFQATGSGPRNATVTINNSDADEAVYSFAITGEATLITPVQLISFNGYLQGKNVNLQWKTAAELNNTGFYIERANSVNGPWQQIAHVNSTNRSGGDVYNYTDISLNAGVYVYRLQQIDTDGSNSYSSILVFNLNNVKNAISIFPNPVKDVVNIYAYRQDLLNTSFQVMAADGKLMAAGKINGTQTNVACGNWKAGIYIVKFSDGSVQRIVKQ